VLAIRERVRISKERAPSLGFRVLEILVGRAWGIKKERVAKGGAPLMRGPHKTS
jgi:hypothetical protein